MQPHGCKLGPWNKPVLFLTCLYIDWRLQKERGFLN
jgi:hypothetical protein